MGVVHKLCRTVIYPSTLPSYITPLPLPNTFFEGCVSNLRSGEGWHHFWTVPTPSQKSRYNFLPFHFFTTIFSHKFSNLLKVQTRITKLTATEELFEFLGERMNIILLVYNYFTRTIIFLFRKNCWKIGKFLAESFFSFFFDAKFS